jgi:hypothetical protein
MKFDLQPCHFMLIILAAKAIKLPLFVLAPCYVHLGYVHLGYVHLARISTAVPLSLRLNEAEDITTECLDPPQALGLFSRDGR